MDVREKLEVIAHLGDHITYKEDIGICYDSDLAKVIEDSYMTLNNGVTVQEWISVKDRLPEKEGEYITYTDRGQIHFDCFCIYPNHGTKFWVGGNGKVTHWMEKPQPPKGE